VHAAADVRAHRRSLVTEMAVIGFPGGRATLIETGPGVSVEQVVAATEAKLVLPEKIPPMQI
jgi:acetate CoA/acetoacetate CoA-transferase beta subunit